MASNLLCSRRMAQVGLLVAASAVARSSQAQTSLHAIGGAVTGYDSNVMSASEHPPPGMPVRQRDGLFQLQTGLALISDSPRFLQSIEYVHTATVYFEHTGANAGADRLSWAGIYQLSQRSELQIGAEIARGRQNLANLLRPAVSTTVTARPTGPIQFVTSTVSAGYRYDITPVWAFRDGGTFRWYTPIGVSGPRADRYDLDNIAGLEREWARDTLSAGIRTGYFVSAGTATSSSQQQVIVGAVLRWRRELSRTLSSSIEGGFASAAKVDDLGNNTASPTGRAALAFATDDGQAELFASRTVEPNLLVNQNFITDAVGLHGVVPIVRSMGLMASASAGYLHNRRVPVTPEAVRANADVWMADVALGWAPIPGLTVEARYQRTDQSSDSVSGVPPTYSRDVALLTLHGMFPNRPVSGVLSTYADRVDRNDPRRVRPRRGDGEPLNGRGGSSTGTMDRNR